MSFRFDEGNVYPRNSGVKTYEDSGRVVGVSEPGVSQGFLGF